MENKLTDRRVVILKALVDGPKSWTFLRLMYYPSAERQESAASTSFNNQLKRMMQHGLICKTLIGYEITEEGLRQYEEVEEHGCARCNTSISASMTYCVGCQEDLKAAGRIV